MQIDYLMQPLGKWTFKSAPKTKEWVENQCKGKVLNLYAGATRLDVDEYRIDLSDEFEPDLVMNSIDFVHTTDMKFDTILLDPPYSFRKSKELYGNKRMGPMPILKNAIERITNPGHRVIQLGYETGGMGKKRGPYKKIALAVICHGGELRDTLVLVEEKQ